MLPKKQTKNGPIMLKIKGLLTIILHGKRLMRHKTHSISFHSIPATTQRYKYTWFHIISYLVPFSLLLSDTRYASGFSGFTFSLIKSVDFRYLYNHITFL